MEKKHILYFLICLLCIFSIEYTFNFTHLFVPKINVKENYKTESKTTTSSYTIPINLDRLKTYLDNLNAKQDKQTTGKYKISKFAYNSLCGL